MRSKSKEKAIEELKVLAVLLSKDYSVVDEGISKSIDYLMDRIYYGRVRKG